MAETEILVVLVVALAVALAVALLEVLELRVKEMMAAVASLATVLGVAVEVPALLEQLEQTAGPMVLAEQVVNLQLPEQLLITLAVVEQALTT
jgi:Tfp pilus assembly protein PilO